MNRMFPKKVSQDIKNPFFVKGHKSPGNNGHPHGLMYLKAILHNVQGPSVLLSY